MTSSRVGRPRVPGNFHCHRCNQSSKRHRVTWPDGRICTPCFVRAVETFGACAWCDDERMLPGRDEHHRPICRICARITTDLDCRRCGAEAELIRRKLCVRCVLREDLESLLAPNDPPDLRLKRLVNVLCAVDRPASIRTWMRGAAANELLTAIGRRKLDLEHAALDALHQSTAVDHLRSLLVAHHVLPDRGNEDLARFDRWLDHRLAGLAPRPRIASALEPFARWHHARRLHDDADIIRNLNYATRAAKQEITEAGRFLAWLDEYLADGPSTRKTARNFINWNRSIGAVRVQAGRRRDAVSTPMASDTERLEQLGRLMRVTDMPLAPRVVGLLMLLYGTPIGRLVQLRRDAVTEAPDGMRIDLGGSQPALVPGPISQLMYEMTTTIAATRTATVDAGWLFPGVRIGRHVHPDSVRERLRAIGITVLAGRNATLADLTQQLHPAVLADILGIGAPTLTRHALRGGLAYASYTSQPLQPRATSTPLLSRPATNQCQ